jgi:hypothetical protein
MTVQERALSVRQQLRPLITRELAGIAAIDTAIAHETAPDYVVMFHDAKNGKQANIEQLATLLRMHGGTPDEGASLRKALTTSKAAVASRFSTKVVLRSMRHAEVDLVTRYTDAVATADGLVKRALTKALGRALVQAHVLTAHIAKRTANQADARLLPLPLDEYFAGSEPRACMRCHLDRPGRTGALERTDPHPYTYVCAACHDDVLGEFSVDLAEQMEHWSRELREAKVLQRALGRVSKLNAIGRALHPLSGLEPDLPTPAAERAVIVPAMTPTPGPADGERPGVLNVETTNDAEAAYVEELFAVRGVWRHW